VTRRSLLVIPLLALVAVLLSAASAALALAPGLIVFQGRRGPTMAVYTMNPRGGGAEVVTPGLDPSISRDGKTIVFAKDTAKGQEIFTIGVNGTGLKQLTDDPGVNSEPAVSADGKKVVFVGNRDHQGGELPRIFTVGIDGTGERQLTKSDDLQVDLEPTFAPDGTRIAFIRGPGETQLMTMTAAGADVTAVTKKSADPFSGPQSPSYSPNGKRILFQATAPRDGSQFFACDAADGGNRVEITKGDSGGFGFEPAYSPDGSSIVFRRGKNLFTMDSDGSNVKPLTDLDPDRVGFNNFHPSWGR
jgi:Tol biopolymer transport system component